jgi:hypothetical protein
MTIADTDYIEKLSLVVGENGEESLRFEMETSTVCDTDSDFKFKFVTHLGCDIEKTTLDWEKDLEKVWYTEPCEYHVMFKHAAGCEMLP